MQRNIPRIIHLIPRVSGLALSLFIAIAVPVKALEEDFSRGMLNRQDVLAQAKEVTKEKYPNADVVTVDRLERIRYNPDGTYVQWAEIYQKILTEKGRQRLQTISSHFTIPYQRGPEDCRIPLVEIIRPDGTTVEIDVASNSRIVTSGYGMQANIYDPNDKVIQLTLPGLEIGDMLHAVFYDRIVHPRVRGVWADQISFESTDPILRAAAEIFAPPEKDLRKIAIKDRVGETLRQEREVLADGTIRYRWEAQNVPQFFPEPNMPEAYRVTQRVLVSTAEDWREISRWYWKICEPHLAVTPAMQAKVDRLTQGLEDRRAKIEAIFRFVSQKIRYLGITMEDTAPGYEPHDASLTFENRHGVCRDKAALLVAMLRAAGLEAFPVIIHNGPKKDEEVPDPFFNHAITAVREPDGSYLLMDATDEKTSELFPAYLNNQSYLVATPEGETLLTSPIIPADRNLMQITTRARLDAAGSLFVETDLAFHGINDNVYRGWFARCKPEERRRYFEGLIKKAAPGAELRELILQPEEMGQTEIPLRARLVYEAKDILVRGEDQALLPMPLLGTSIGMVNWILGSTGLPTRRFPFKTDIACGITETVTLELDPGFREVHLPASKPIATPTHAWQLLYREESEADSEKAAVSSATSKPRRIRANALFRLDGVEFSPAEYLALRETLKEVEVDLRKRPYLVGLPTPPPQEEGDAVFEAIHSEYLLKDAHSWTERHTVRQKIRTYAGVKKYAEIKIPFNPAWTEVHVEEAAVTLPDGSVRTISDKEINVMDAPWAGTAPRYPPGKILVASLPGVTIGATLTYTIVTTCHHRPFWGIQEGFQTFDPIRKQEVTLRLPRKLLSNLGETPRECPSLSLEDPSPSEKKIRLYFRGTHPALLPSQREEGEDLILTWCMESQPRIRSEELLPPLFSFTPTLFASTGDWATYARIVFEALHAAASHQPETERRTGEILAALPSDATAEAKIIAIRDFVARSVRQAGPWLHELPLTAITPADRTLVDGYGNTSDRAVLLYAMLKTAGFHPSFVLASWAPKLESLHPLILAYPLPETFPQVLVCVETERGSIYLNDTDQYAALGVTLHDGRLGLLLPQGTPVVIRALPDCENRQVTRYELEIAENGDARLKKIRLFFGTLYGATKKFYAELPPEERRRHILETIAAMSQAAELEGEFETRFETYPGEVFFTIHIPHFAVQDGNRLYFNLPESLVGVLAIRQDERHHPLYWAEPKRVEIETILRFPPFFHPRILPAPWSWEAPAGGGRISSPQIEKREGIVRMVTKAELLPAILPPYEYGRVREANRLLNHPRTNTVLLERP